MLIKGVHIHAVSQRQLTVSSGDFEAGQVQRSTIHQHRSMHIGQYETRGFARLEMSEVE